MAIGEISSASPWMEKEPAKGTTSGEPLRFHTMIYLRFSIGIVEEEEVIKKLVWNCWRHGRTWFQSSPRACENWWQELKHTDLVSGRIFDFSDNKLAQDQNLLDQEKYIRQFLEQARKIAKIASKHLGGAPQERRLSRLKHGSQTSLVMQ